MKKKVLSAPGTNSIFNQNNNGQVNNLNAKNNNAGDCFKPTPAAQKF
ncbi:MAG: hypothetical protein K2Q14_07865 [Gammaproteobacteria bacterium]|nr:hypothetical protein [Gammaproteobacteria bacterium]